MPRTKRKSAKTRSEEEKKRRLAVAGSVVTEKNASMGLAPPSEEKSLASRRLASRNEKIPLNAFRFASPIGSLSISSRDVSPNSDSQNSKRVCTPVRVPSPNTGVAGQTKLVGQEIARQNVISLCS